MTAIAIRAASSRDAAMLARLHAQCFEQAWDKAAFAVFLDDAVTFALLAGAADKEQAFILVRAVADECENSFAWNAVRRAPLWSRTCAGTGGRPEAHRRGARRMFLEVAADNVAALALYGQAGLVPTGRRLGYYARLSGQAADAVILSTDLAGFS